MSSMSINKTDGKTRKKVERRTRTKTGCFTCRHRKLKCDESKPKCKGCARRSLECVWPTGGKMSLPHCTDFIPRKDKEKNFFQFVVSIAEGDHLRKINVTDCKNKNITGRAPHLNVENEDSRSDLFGKNVEFLDAIPKFNRTTERIFFENDNKPMNVASRLTGNTLSDTYKDLSYSYPSPLVPAAEITSSPATPASLVLGQTFNTSDVEKFVEGIDASWEGRKEREEARNKEKIEHALHFIQKSRPSNITQINLNGYNTWIPGVALSSEDAYFYHIFIHGFIVAISPQCSHPKLMPGAIFVPQGAYSKILREIFYVCGASYLSWRIPELKPIAQRKYVSCLEKLAIYINSSKIDCTDDWMMVAMLLLCLREKYYGAFPSKPAAHLTMAFRIIRKRQRKGHDQNTLIGDMDVDAHLSPNLTHNYIHRVNGDILADEMKDHIETASIDSFGVQPFNNKDGINSFRSIEPKEYNEILQQWNNIDTDFMEISSKTNGKDYPFYKSNFKVSATHKLLVESFLYNYSVQLLITDRKLINYLPSPYDIFEEFKSLLQTPVYDCPVSWMNNPVFGAAYVAFELAAKASWLCFQSPLDKQRTQMAQELHMEAMMYTPPPLPDNCKNFTTPGLSEKLKESTIVADIVARAAYILMSKVVNSELNQENEAVQENVDYICSQFQQLSHSSTIWIICGWPLVVAGVAAISESHKSYIKSRCIMLSNLFHAEHMTQIADFMQEAWGDNDNPGKGWDVLLDRQSLQKICI